jgi:hypothetical protein
MNLLEEVKIFFFIFGKKKLNYFNAKRKHLGHQIILLKEKNWTPNKYC